MTTDRKDGDTAPHLAARGSVVVREARAGDAPALASLATELGYPSDPPTIASRLGAITAADGDVVFVAEVEGAIVGFIHGTEKQLLVSELYVELGGLIVSASARRRGAARALIEAVERWARGRGVALLRVRTRVEREVADVAYRRCGFELEKQQRVFVKPLAGPSSPHDPR